MMYEFILKGIPKSQDRVMNMQGESQTSIMLGKHFLK